MLFPVNQDYNKLSFSIDAAASLVFLMRKQRDAFGVSVFSDQLDFYSPSKSSLTHQRFILTNLEKIIKKKYSQDSKLTADISVAINRMAMTISKRSLVFIFSDFMAVTNFDEFANSIKHLRHHMHEIVVFDISHNQLENELSLKNKYYNIVDMETGEKIKLHPTEIKEKFIQRRSEFRAKLKRTLVNQKVEFISANIEDGFDDILLQYLIKRKISIKKV